MLITQVRDLTEASEIGPLPSANRIDFCHSPLLPAETMQFDRIRLSAPQLSGSNGLGDSLEAIALSLQHIRAQSADSDPSVHRHLHRKHFFGVR